MEKFPRRKRREDTLTVLSKIATLWAEFPEYNEQWNEVYRHLEMVNQLEGEDITDTTRYTIG